VWGRRAVIRPQRSGGSTMSLRPSPVSYGLMAAALLSLTPLAAEAQPQGRGREGRVERQGPSHRQQPNTHRERWRGADRRADRPDRQRGPARRAERPTAPQRQRGSERRAERPRNSPPPARVDRGRDVRRGAHGRGPRYAAPAPVSTYPRWKYHGHRYRRPYVVP